MGFFKHYQPWIVAIIFSFFIAIGISIAVAMTGAILSFAVSPGVGLALTGILSFAGSLFVTYWFFTYMSRNELCDPPASKVQAFRY